MAPPSAADATATAKYFHSGAFNHAQIRQDFTAAFKKDGHYNAASANDLDTLLGFIETDGRVSDVRWMAYMLATAYWETSHLVKEQRPVISKKTHKPAIDPKTGKEVMHDVKVWRNMSPVEEMGHGKGRGYFQPVKVQPQPDGSAIVTEHDGDQWKVSTNGTSTPFKKGTHPHLGAAAAGAAAKTFTNDPGVEHAYFGRGYVQLTWWSNYATTGAAIGEGLNLLLDPDRAMDPKVAYAVMSYGMITGGGFANKHKLSDYFHGAATDYAKARHMVNGTDHAADIAKIAKLFEGVLLQNKIAGTPATATSTSAQPIPMPYP